jgi:hypothetical protein
MFSQDIYDRDDTAKFDVIQWLLRLGYQDAWVNPDQYGIDVLAFDWDGTKQAFEVEVKQTWTGPKFPFVTVHFSARKLKFAKPLKTIWFTMLNQERTHILGITGETFLQCPVVAKDTIYTQGERFVAVPLERATLWKI